MERIVRENRARQIIVKEIEVRKAFAQYPHSPEEMYKEDKEIEETVEREKD